MLKEVENKPDEVKSLWLKAHNNVFNFRYNSDICIHKWAGYGDLWFLSWEKFGITRYSLHTSDFKIAQDKAKEFLTCYCQNTITHLKTVCNALDLDN